MFFGKKDNGEKRVFECKDEFFVDQLGKVHNADYIDIEVATKMVVADAMECFGKLLIRDAEALQREARNIIDDDMFGAMVSGS